MPDSRLRSGGTYSPTVGLGPFPYLTGRGVHQHCFPVEQRSIGEVSLVLSSPQNNTTIRDRPMAGSPGRVYTRDVVKLLAPR